MKNKIFQKKSVRVIAIILIAVMSFGIIGSLLAGRDVPEENETGHSHPVSSSDVLLFADCDSLDGWKEVKIGGLYPEAINTQIKTRGLGSVGGTVTDAEFIYSTKVFLLHYETSKALDISNMTHFAFDMYVEDAAAFEGKHFTVEIGSTYQVDVNELQSKGLRFAGLKDGWNHIELDLDAMKTYETAASFDPTNTVRFRVYNGDGGGSYSGLLLFDNFYFTNKPVGQMVS